MASPSCRGPHWPCCCSADTLRRPVARVAGFPKACGLRPSRTLQPSCRRSASATVALSDHPHQTMPQAAPKRPIRPAHRFVADRWRRPRGLPGGGCWRRLPTCARFCGAGGEPNPFPSSPAPRRAPSTPPRWPCGADNFDRAVRRIARCGGKVPCQPGVRGRFTERDVQRRALAHAGVDWLGAGPLAAHAPAVAAGQKPLKNYSSRWCRWCVCPAHPQGAFEGAGRHGVQLQLGRTSPFESAEPVKPWVRSQRKAAAATASRTSTCSRPQPFRSSSGQGHRGGRPHRILWRRLHAPVRAHRPKSHHLGAERILVIGAGRMHGQRTTPPPTPRPTTRRLRKLRGTRLSNIFLDALAVDVERVQRINQTLSLIPEEKRAHSACGRLSCWSSPPRSGWMPWPPAMGRPAHAVRTMLARWASRRTWPTCAVRRWLATCCLGRLRRADGLGRADTLAMRAGVPVFGWTDTGAEVRTQLHQ